MAVLYIGYKIRNFGTDCMLHIPLIFTTYVRNLNWHILGAFTSMKNSLRNLQPVNWSSRHYHALFRKPNVLLVLGLCYKQTNLAHVVIPCFLISV